MDRILTVLLGAGLAALMVLNFLTIRRQQTAITILMNMAIDGTAIFEDHHTKIWDLRQRVGALEQEDKRLLSHIKWFVMRRSGTDELRKMEAAVARLEASE